MSSPAKLIGKPTRVAKVDWEAQIPVKPIGYSSSAVALVIVLAFIVLLAGLVVAFFSRAVLDRQISNSSATQAKADLMAQGATDQIIADLKQEIAAGSVSPVTTFSDGTKLYIPKAGAASPVRVGVNSVSTADAAGSANMIKRSASGVFYPASYDSNAPQRGSGFLTITSSLNGRSISAARWNKPLLLQKSNAASDTDFTPLANFGSNGTTNAPAWILVARDGTPMKTLASITTNPALTNNNYVIGRYAYIVYDEGGLLDLNVAGYPLGNAPGSAPLYTNSNSDAEAAYKSTLSFADLSQLPGLSSLTTSRQQAVINSLVGWRNYASAQPGGSLSTGFDFTGGSPTGLKNFTASTLSNSNGFLKTGNTTINNGQSDRLFTSRQEALKFLLSGVATTSSERANLQNALQYLGTFSRDVNQPSFSPDASRPRIANLAAGGNDASGGDDIINPSLIKTRVVTGFTRNNGSTATAGEPLLKRRFPLNYLAWLTYEGPSNGSASTSTKNALLAAGISQDVIDLGDALHIQKYFGLTWSNGAWTYRGGSNAPIATLSGITGREPDFFELLKASVNVGSLGKAYVLPGQAATTPDGYNQQRDNSVDAQIMQLAANMIDQFDFDGYPTRIIFNDGLLFGGRNLEYRGVEDLPYLYRVREGKVMTQDSVPSVGTLPQIGGVITNAGSGVVLQEPEIWNPHAMTSVSTTAPRPTAFRLVAATVDPITNTPTSYILGAQWRPEVAPNATWTAASSTSLNASLTFNIPSSRQDLFREPTLLIKPNVPSGSGLAGPGPFTLDTTMFGGAEQVLQNGVSDDGKYTGIPMGTVPMAFAATFSAGAVTGNPAGGAGISPVGFIYYPTSGNAGSFPYITYRLQCQDSTGQWVTYDEKYASVACASSYNTPSGATGTAGNRTFWKINANYALNAIGSELSVAAFDPRSSRFGMTFSGCNGRGVMAFAFPLSSSTGYLMDGRITPISIRGWAAPINSLQSSPAIQNAARQNAVMTSRPDEYSGLAISTGTGQALSFGYNCGPSAVGWFPSGTSVVIRQGMTAQNDPNVDTTIPARYSGDGQFPATYASQYFADPDGVVRRGMSGFMSTSLPSSGAPSGLPLKPAYSFDTLGNASAITVGANANDYASRPVVLNRPFRSVAELGYVFSGTPWRNLDCTTPESGSVALFDTFCINDSQDVKSLVAGRVNINTRQLPVFQAILTGSYRDSLDPTGSGVAPLMTSALASSISTALVNRTTSAIAGQGPMANISELVGKWYSSVAVNSSVNGSKSYIGFSSDTVNNNNDLSSTLTTSPDQRLQRTRAAAIRTLTNTCTARVWNLMLDVVAQTGRYPINTANLNQFNVEGEQRYWVHVAIDRWTGQVLDKQVEVIKE